MRKVFKTPLLLRWFYHRRVWGFSNSKKVFLTFDDGPTTALTEWILHELKEKNVKATFFCVGQNAKDHPELIDQIVKEGHAVGNHTMFHNNADKTSNVEYEDSTAEASQYIQSKLFRPPYGRLSLLKGRTILKNYKIIMWSWLSYDYDKSVSIELILKNAQKQIGPGDILVLHDNVKVNDRLKEILPAVIDIVRQKGLEFDVISS